MSETATIGSTARDFDFLIGRWNVRNLRLRERLVGSNDWEEFDATSVARPLFDGMGNEDEFRTDHDGGFIGMSFRFFDAASQRWSIYWADSRRCGVLDPPVFGIFDGDVGVLKEGLTRWTTELLVPLLLVQRRDVNAALGADRLRRRRRRVGAELGDGVHPDRRGRVMSTSTTLAGMSPDYRHVDKLIAPGAVLELGRYGSLKWYDIRSPGRYDPRRHRRSRAEMPRRRDHGWGDRARGPRLRHPPSLRRGVLLPPRLQLGRQQRALGDRLGQGRRCRSDIPPLAARARPPSDVLRLGARRRVARAAGVEPLPSLR